MTNDVETTSLELNKPDDCMIKKVKNIGLPRLIEPISKHDIESTFFFTGHIVEKQPEIVDIVKDHGHEIGCHGYIHEPAYFFDALNLQKQVHYLQRAKKIIETAANSEVVSFRGPEARINEDTIKALEITKFKFDSSIAPQRFDGPMSRGFRKKLFWMIAPRRPYYISKDSIVHEGSSKILEIPISAFLFPFIGSTMRVSPFINKIIENILLRESKVRKNPIVFLFHPTETIEIDEKLLNTKAGIEGTFLSGIVRKKVKIKNLGKRSIELLEQIIRHAKAMEFQFISISRFGKQYKKEV